MFGLQTVIYLQLHLKHSSVKETAVIKSIQIALTFSL